ncbi:hypothetical protein CRM90_10870 [Mycobacterium sp. ENV421]|uniref:hypothetical protein n=1 Tax=Mycobacterium sp. ENV421 TaxID=1213407 RepID=UPI000C9AAE33|nr:hypothetical protein [Mycobacterium sp. ENV421]PND57506.1 hypothetical protein CRM90_10870 [Mycobacterium sp. ENV421]
MSPEATDQAWLEDYAHNYLWVDDEWMEVGDRTFTYWQARLAQTTTIKILPDGRAKWCVRTRIVNDVAGVDAATRLCFALNSYAAGWSFAYDRESRSIDAIIAMCVPLEFDTWQLRLSETAKLSGWMSDVIAGRLAAAASGVPAYTYPAHQSSVRGTLDGSYYYLETLRGRPENVFDTTRRLYPGLEQVAAEFGRMIGVANEQVVADDAGIHIAIEDTGADLHAWFAEHPIFGNCWHTAVRFSTVLSGETAAQVSAMAWHLFADDESTLLGAWHADDGDLVFAQWSTTSELRHQESLPSNRGRSSAEVHSVGDLWGLTSAVNGAIHLTLAAVQLVAQSTQQIDEAARTAATVIASISDVARSALAVTPAERGEPTDRRLLWLERKYVLAIAAWFNPIGPSVCTLEVCSLPDRDEEYLLYFLRHPYLPDYRVLGVITPGDDSVSATKEGIEMFFHTGSLPHTLVFFDARHAISSELPHMFRDQIIRVSREHGIDLSENAKKLKDAAGNPWALAPHGELPDATRPPTDQSPASEGDPEAAVDQWWAEASKPDNFFGIFAQLPDAWDGALNFQLSAGDIRSFDAGPLLIRYSSIGTIEK